VKDYLTASAKHDVSKILEVLENYNCPDPVSQRARTTIISCFNMEEPENHEITLD